LSGSDSDEGGAVGYFRQLHVELLAVLVVVFVVLVIVGWHLRPSSGGFPPVNDGLVLYYSGTALTKESEIITLTPGGGSTLSVAGDSPAASDSWKMTISGLAGGRFCGTGIKGVRAQVKVVPTSGSSTETVVRAKESGGFILMFCWPTGGVADIDGAYLSAAFPMIESEGAPTVSGRVAIPGGVAAYNPSYQLLGVDQFGSDRDWAVQTQAPASRVGAWSWSSDVGSPFSVAAVNTNTSQHDDYLTFLSGVILGLAAGALISILTELVAPLSRRRDDRTDSALRRTP
jgi:hypothetical protein